MGRVLLILILSAVCAAAVDGRTLPEIERLRASHQQAVAEIRSNVAKPLASARQNYLGRLRDLLKQISPQGDDNATQAVLTELGRIEKGVEPTAEERRRLTGLLLASRVLYEKAAGPPLSAAIKAESDAKAVFLQGLLNLEARYAKLLEFEKIAAVKAERDRITQSEVKLPAPQPPLLQLRRPQPEGLDVTKATEELRDTRWHMTGVRGHPPEKHWIRFNADGSLFAGWHSRKGAWKITPEGIIEAEISYKKGHISRFKLSSDLQTASSTNGGATLTRIKGDDPAKAASAACAAE